MELKLKQFAEIETLLMKECEQVEKTRQRFAAERARMVSARFGSPGQTSNTNNLQGMSLSTGGGNNVNTLLQQQQQQGSASSSQPSIIPGFSNNPQLHAQMQFMARQQQQQQAFSFGPRLPLNAIQTNAGSTPSLFGNNQLNNNPAGAASINQPPFSHPMVRSSTGSASGSGLGLN